MSDFEKIPKGIFDKVKSNKELFISEFKEKLQAIFPSTVKDGIVDFEALLNEFGKYVETDEKEKYNMTWVGKQEAIKKANEDIIGKTLKYVPEDSKNSETTQNLYIEGDNLEVLKLLKNSYYGKVKMIYIDPPYNTGNDFIYNDDFKMNKDEYDKVTGCTNEYNERLTASKKGSGRYHSKWLSMMCSRLRVAKDLLTDDGVMFISIDNNEIYNLRKICDEIFGEDKFIEEIIWKNKYGSGAKTKGFIEVHEYILCYSKNKILSLTSELGEKERKKYIKKDENFQKLGGYRTQPLMTRSLGDRENLIYPIYYKGIKIMPNKQWVWSQERLEKAIAKNYVEFKEKKDGSYTVEAKKYIYDENGNIRRGKPISILSGPFNQDGTKENKELFNEETLFDFAKPSDLIKFLISLEFNEVKDKNFTIVDFFSGSATTAHAVMKLNAEDGGNRKFIMIQVPETCDEKSLAYKAGYKNICEIGKERIRRAGEKILEDNKDNKEIENLDVGFKVFKVADTNIKWISDTLDNNTRLDDYRVETSKKDRLDFNPHFTDIDVVYEMILKRQDIELTERIDKLNDIGDRTYLVGYTILVCLEEEITEEMVTKISNIDTSLSWIIFRDSAFDDDINLKTNTINLLRRLLQERDPKNKNQKILWI